MGTKVNPKGFRLGQTTNWDSSWRAANKLDFSKKFHLDLQIKELITTTLNYRGILVGKLFIREINSESSNFLIIKGTYYITPNFINNLKKEQKLSNINMLNDSVHDIIQHEVQASLIKFISKYGLSFNIELDLTNILNLGYNHSLETIRNAEQKLKGPLNKAGYVKDLYLICHKMILLKDTTMFGNAIVPLLEKTTGHNMVITNIEKICNIVFDQYKGINGLRLDFKGRIGGSARSRSKSFTLGSLSNQQIDSNISYSFHESITRYGVCSLKIWLC
jgi:hypothetical protein